MRIGKTQKIDWKQYDCRNFKFIPQVNYGECGGFALHILTKQPYEKIAKMSRKGHWPNSVMFDYLRRYGCEIIPVTLGNTVNAHSVKKGKPKIGPRNVLLINQHVYKEESTWSVIYNNHWAHSGDVEMLDPMQFINWPIAEAYLIYNKDWK